METPTNLMEVLLESVESFGKTTLQLAKLKALEKTTIVATSLITRISVILAISVFALVLNLGIALMLGDFLGKNYYGFFIVAAFYLVLAVALHFWLPGWINRAVSNLIIREITNNDEQDNFSSGT